MILALIQIQPKIYSLSLLNLCHLNEKDNSPLLKMHLFVILDYFDFPFLILNNFFIFKFILNCFYLFFP